MTWLLYYTLACYNQSHGLWFEEGSNIVWEENYANAQDRQYRQARELELKDSDCKLVGISMTYHEVKPSSPSLGSSAPGG